MKSIIFQIDDGDPITIDFDEFDIWVLHQICRILDIHNYKNTLVLKVGREMYKEIDNCVCRNAWLTPPTWSKEDEFNIKIDGFDFLIKNDDSQ